jgi:hypothetical protein
MITKELLKSVKVSQAITPTAGAAAATDIEGTVIDMAGFEGVLAIVTFGAIAANAVTGIKMQQGTDATVTDAADILGTSQTVADDDDGQIFCIDLFKPRERYVRLYVDRATQNAVVASAEYIQYGARTEPVTSASTTVNVESHIAPAEGTA